MRKEKPFHRNVIGVAIPTFNSSLTVVDTIESVKSQNSNCRIFVRDNCSDDCTVAKLRIISDEFFSFKVNDFNIGGARNFIKVADDAKDSDFIHWLASDDIIGVDWHCTNERCLIEKSGNIAFGRVCHIDEKGHELVLPSSFFQPTHLDSSNSFFRKIYFFLLPEDLGQCNAIYGLFKSEFLISQLQMHGFFEEPYCDYLFISKIIEDTRIHFNDSILYKRISKNSWEKRQKENSLLKPSLNYLIYLFKIIARSSPKYVPILLMLLPLKLVIFFISKVSKRLG